MIRIVASGRRQGRLPGQNSFGLAERLVAASRAEAGNVSYGLYASADAPDASPFGGMEGEAGGRNAQRHAPFHRDLSRAGRISERADAGHDLYAGALIVQRQNGKADMPCPFFFVLFHAA